MRTCILNVTNNEFDKILQINHDSLEWSNRDKELVHQLRELLGGEVVHDICQFDKCRMRKLDNLSGVRRVEANYVDSVVG